VGKHYERSSAIPLGVGTLDVSVDLAPGDNAPDILKNKRDIAQGPGAQSQGGPAIFGGLFHIATLACRDARKWQVHVPLQISSDLFEPAQAAFGSKPGRPGGRPERPEKDPVSAVSRKRMEKISLG
jgi:hypothetical protein